MAESTPPSCWEKKEKEKKNIVEVVVCLRLSDHFEAALDTSLCHCALLFMPFKRLPKGFAFSEYLHGFCRKTSEWMLRVTSPDDLLRRRFSLFVWCGQPNSGSSPTLALTVGNTRSTRVVRVASPFQIILGGSLLALFVVQYQNMFFASKIAFLVIRAYCI